MEAAALRLPWCCFQKPGVWSDPALDMVFLWGFIKKKTGGAGFLETMVIVVMIVIVMVMGRTAQAQSYS